MMRHIDLNYSSMMSQVKFGDNVTITLTPAQSRDLLEKLSPIVSEYVAFMVKEAFKDRK